MSSSTNEGREQSEITNTEESNLNTIEFLRARLLSERCVSKTSRQRADDLAKRVAELEEQLKFVTLQRKKAEKATSDVLAILENHGISDVSEEFDSCSEQGESLEEFNARNGTLTLKEASNNVISRKNEKDAYSSSEVESSRSLSWRSTKDTQRSLEKKKHVESVRRRASFSSNSSSARKVGKSCRRIRRRETRSMDEPQNDTTENAAYSRDASNCSDGEPVTLAESSGYANGKSPLESPRQGPSSGSQKVTSLYFGVQEKDEDMESALQHQAQLIGRFEEEEKAQREWEEKFGENNGGTQDSCDPGAHSDITEERYDSKSPELSCAVRTIDSDNREKKQESADAGPGEPPPTSEILPPVTISNKEDSQSEKSNSGKNARESSASEFTFPMSGNISSSYVAKSTPPSADSGTPSSFEIAVVPQETSNSLGSVLEALQKAKLSLNQKLCTFPQVEGEASRNIVNPSYTETSKVDGFQIPITTPGLFRLPTDYQLEATTRANPGIGEQPSFAIYPPEIATSRNAVSGDPFLTAPVKPFSQEMRVVSTQRSLSLSQPRLSESGPPSNKMNHLDPYRSPVLPPVGDSYPLLPDGTLRFPMNREGASRTFPSSGKGLPPVMRLSSYDGRAGPNTYR